MSDNGQKPLTIDERLERLTERHEALTQSVEILVGSMTKLTDHMEQLSIVVLEHERRLNEMDGGKKKK